MKCKCGITSKRGDMAVILNSLKVKFCPLHAAAADMLKLLKKMSLKYQFELFSKDADEFEKVINKAEGR